MKKYCKKVCSVLLAGTMVISLAACGGGNSGQTEATTTTVAAAGETSGAAATETGTPDAVQELNLVFTDLKTLDVNDIRNANEFLVMSQVQEGLFRTFTDEKGNEVATEAGCESYEVSEDGLTYTFKLRDHKWSDGAAVTAQQYVDSFIRLLDPKLAFSYSFMAYDIKNAEAYYNGEVSADQVGVKAVDDKTFQIELSAAIPFFVKKLSNVCFFPIRKDIIDKVGDETYKSDYKVHVFNGPFVISERILENEMVLTKNEDYWDAENVILQKVTLKAVTEPATQSLLLDSNELDAIKATGDYVAKWMVLADEGKLVYHNNGAPMVGYIGFNQHTGGVSGLMNNAKIRKALSLSLDREEFNELIYNGVNSPAYSLIPYNLMSGDNEFRGIVDEPLKAEAEEYTNSPEKLQALFKEGLKEEGKSDDLSQVELIFISQGSTVQQKAELEYFQQTWEAKLGIKIKLNILADSSLFVTDRNANQYDLLSQAWHGDYNDPMTFMELWNTESGYAKFMGGYHNAEFDAMFDSLSTESDNEKRAETYIKMEQNLISENAGVAPLYFENKQMFVQSYVKNLSMPLFGTEFDFSRAYISGKPQ